MRVFEKFNEKAKCYLCETNENKPCCLIAKDGTENGNNEQAVIVHIECIPQLRLTKFTDKEVIYVGFSK